MARPRGLRRNRWVFQSMAPLVRRDTVRAVSQSCHEDRERCRDAEPDPLSVYRHDRHADVTFDHDFVADYQSIRLVRANWTRPLLVGSFGLAVSGWSE